MIDPVSIEYRDLEQLGTIQQSIFQSAVPFPHIYFDNFFDQHILNLVLNEFPDLSRIERHKINNPRQRKFATNGTDSFGVTTSSLLNFMNGDVFLNFLQIITSINEPLISDSTFLGGGLHEIKRSGLLKIHTDFAKHRITNLDRRLNVLVFLNKNWKDEYGGGLELWDANMSTCKVKIAPIFNRLVIFETTQESFHGHPDPLLCPAHITRKSIALYYYSQGRPKSQSQTWEKSKEATTFYARPGNTEDTNALDDYSLQTRVINKIKRILGRRNNE
ncbi:MAG: hypothetical protein ACJAS3_000944 [Roseivirga sp.]|jgi:hypothetical protein